MLHLIAQLAGVNLDTETAYYFKDKGGKLSADTTMDKESCRITPNNPSGLKINTGVGYETSDTSQPFLDGACRSGDGTLPYSSMAYARVWQQQEGGNVDIIGACWCLGFYRCAGG